MQKSPDHLNDFPKEEVRSAIRAGILQAEAQQNVYINNKHRNRKNIRKRNIVYTLAGLAAAFGILVGSSYHSPALASSLSQIPIIGSVFGDSNVVGLKQAQKNGLTNKIGETQTINGISVTIEEILYDQNAITVGYKIEAEKELGENYFGSGANFTINKTYSPVGSGGYGENIQLSTVRTAIQELTVTKDLPNAFELGIVLHGDKGETWYFSAPIKKITDIKKIPIQHSQKASGINLTVTEITLSKTGVGLSFESSEKGTDFEKNRASFIEFKLVDQNGKEVKSYSGGGMGQIIKNNIVFTSTKKFDPIDSDIKELTIIPYLALPENGGGIEWGENGESNELEFKRDSLQSVDFKSFKVKIPEEN
ncbi:DUF4179 domain-containing protein [Niallia nealsonii]|uniref:DUF4179 domain-containing protein n=1 Tax=Niallia nealsonii TaxID=115979 RepID=A0A2N0Z075_9BACI|nr:DUF4179 domain-containing protein [Niallia nealsonii]PKG22910.1 hypothetical protein CWS01_14620 [Niallia nealsonii]